MNSNRIRRHVSRVVSLFPPLRHNKSVGPISRANVIHEDMSYMASSMPNISINSMLPTPFLVNFTRLAHAAVLVWEEAVFPNSLHQKKGVRLYVPVSFRAGRGRLQVVWGNFPPPFDRSIINSHRPFSFLSKVTLPFVTDVKTHSLKTTY